MNDLMKQLNKYKAIICVLVGVIMVLLSYLYGFNTYRDKKAEVDEEVKTLDATYQRLKQMNDNKEKYVSDTAEYEAKYETLLKKYDADITYDSIIMDTVEMAEEAKVSVNSIALNPKAVVYQFGALPSKNPDNAQPNGLNLDFQGLSASYVLIVRGKYDGVKDFMENFCSNNAEKRKIMTAEAFVYDGATENLTATLTISEFAISGNEREPKKVDIPTMPHGIDNIFYNNAIAN